MEEEAKQETAQQEQQKPSTGDTNSLPIPPSTAVDSSSDFYNTPLTGHTPVYPAMSNSNGNSVPSTPQQQPSEIPGLSFSNSSDQKPLEVGAEDERAIPNDDRVMINAPEAHDESQQPSQPVETIQAEVQAGNAVTEDRMETEATTNSQTETAEEEHPEWEVDSSPYESSTDSSTDSSDDSEDDDEEDYPILSAEETARILMSAEAGSDDEGDGKPSGGAHIRTANEQQEEVAPIPDINVTPDMKIVLLGYVESAVENIILIRASVAGDYQVLESNSLLCLEDRTVIGAVADTLGRVEEPLYTVRFQDSDKIKELELTSGKAVYYVESHSTFVFTQALKGLKGSDASNFHDEEVGEDEVEFSDDEAEAEYKRRLKQKKKEKREGKADSFGRKGRREPPGPSGLRQSQLSYDDGEARQARPTTEDGYTPLARPMNYHEMMGHQEAPVEGPHSSRGRGNFRGRGRGGRGFDRGSGRGRGGHGRGGWDSTSQGPRQDYSRESSASGQYPNYSQPTAPPNSQYSQFPFQQFQQPPQNLAFGQSLPPNMPQFPFQVPAQQNQYGQVPAGAHINPAFFAALQQHQQHQQQQQQQAQASFSAPGMQGQVPQNQAAFNQIQAQLDILRQLAGSSNNPGGNPPR